MTQQRLDIVLGFGMVGQERDSVKLACKSPQLIFIASVHCCRQMNPMSPDGDRFPVASNIWPFLRLAGILNQTLDIFILISSDGDVKPGAF